MPSPNAFAGALLDRAGGLRADPGWVRDRRSDPASRTLLLGTDSVAVSDGDGPLPRPLLLPLEQAPPTGASPLLLGLRDGEAVFATSLSEPVGLAPGTSIMGIREAGGRLAPADAGLVAYAAALLNWHRRHAYCAACGAPSEQDLAGTVRRCPACGAVHHPRIDPVVIMLVSDGPRLLLGRRRTSPAARYSVLAGYVEPGEALEEAVVREVREESGVLVEEVRYHSSQPWPFPGQLMLGFTARAGHGEPRALDGELEHVGWFSRERVAEAVAGRGDLLLPGRVTIARRLIDDWLSATA